MASTARVLDFEAYRRKKEEQAAAKKPLPTPQPWSYVPVLCWVPVLFVTL